MEDELFLIAPVSGEPFVELARSAQGKVFRKHLLTQGPMKYQGRVINVDDKYLDTMIDNFKSNVCPIVQAPLATDSNDHTEAPDRNIGEVIGLEKENGKLYAMIDFRKNADDVGSTLLGASAYFSPNYLDTKTETRVGPTLIHACVTNRPYLTDLDGYEEIVAATNSSKGATVVLLSAATIQENETMDLQELLTLLKTDHNIDVADLQARVANADSAIGLTNLLKTARTNSGAIKLSNGSEVNPDDIVGAVAQIANDNVALSRQMSELVRDKAASEVAEYVRTGFILPTQEETMLDIKLTNPDLFERLIPAAPIVPMQKEEGWNGPNPTPAEDVAIALSNAEAAGRKLGIIK